ncbi:MAG TPA: hypothetical protein VHO25_07490, partial [Polyangiaceae bacterium]|nr:hypothetical protein [Polyangiaceae bacterium]
MTSREFADSGLPVDLYPLTNASEFLAHSFADTFARKAIAASDPSLLGKLKTWLTELYAAIKGAIGLGSSMDRIVNDLINGRFTPTSQTGLATETSVRQSTFVTSEAEAQNAAQLAADKKVEGESLLAQGADIAALLDRFNLGSAPGMVQQAFDFQNWTALRDIGAQLNQGLETYQQLKARFAINSFRRARLAGEAGQQILRFGEMLDFAIKGGQIALQTLSGPRLKSLVNKVQSAALSAIAADQLLTVSKSVFNAALHQATVALSEQARTDLQMAQLQGQIRNLQQASESSVAIEQLLNDMVAVLNSTTEGRAALFTGQGGATRVRSIYADIKKSKGESLHSENLLHWASFILNQSPKLRDALQAAHLAKQSGLRSRLTGFQKKFSDDLNTDPEKTIRKAMRERENQVADKTGAEFLFRQLQESLLEEVEPLVAAADAGAIAAQIKADPQFNALRKEILNDQTSFGGKPAKPFKSATLDGADTVITLPSGRTLGIGHETMDGNQATLRARWDEYNAAVIELENWIANPLNADDPNRRLHEANLQTLQDYYTGQQALMPENRDPIFKHAFSIINIAIAKTASRLSGSARAAVQRMDQMNKWARDWNDRATHALASSQRAAMLSHGIKWNNLTGRSIVQANRLYQQRVGQELAASWQRQEGGLNVGDILSSGEKVTAADIAHLEAQSKAGVESLNIAAKYDRQITEDARGLKTGPNYRHALRTSP